MSNQHKNTRKDVIAIIPARYASTRFPGKPLAMIGGMTMIERVWRQVAQAIPKVVVATDDQRIFEEVTRFGGFAVMTSPDCPNGTARVLEAYDMLGGNEKYIINVQGDEPFIDPHLIAECYSAISCLTDIEIVTAATACSYLEGLDALVDPNRVKVVTDQFGRALYFSRSQIPYVTGDRVNAPTETQFLIHIGLYAFKAEALKKLSACEPTPLEKAERLEQLRWIQNNAAILVLPTNYRQHPVDTPDDLKSLPEQ